MSACGICTQAPELVEEVNAHGVEALEGRISWAEAARRAGVKWQASLKAHMERHYEAAPSPTEQALAAVDPLIAETIEELTAQMRIAPIEVKPFYAVAIQNLQGLHKTQASQQHLINALKAIHEVTGMRMEQRMMLEFAKHAFGQLGAAEPPKPELAQAFPIEAEVR